MLSIRPSGPAPLVGKLGEIRGRVQRPPHHLTRAPGSRPSKGSSRRRSRPRSRVTDLLASRTAGSGRARNRPGGRRRSDLAVQPPQRGQAGDARRGEGSARIPGGAVGGGFERRDRRDLARLGLLETLARPGAGSVEPNQLDKQAPWSARSSIGSATDAPWRRLPPRASFYGRQNGFSASAHASARVRPMSRSM